MLNIKRAILSTEDRKKKFIRLVKNDMQVAKFMQYIVASGLKTTPLSKQYSECYPWCFLLTDGKDKPKKYFLGALATLSECNKRTVYLSYASLERDEAVKNLTASHHLAFWQARMLALLLNNKESGMDNTAWREWTLSLQRSLLPFWEKVLIKNEYRFDFKKNILLSPCCKTDFELSPDAGVEVMPWAEWPQITGKSNESWLWRHNRQIRIIDCQKVAFQ